MLTKFKCSGERPACKACRDHNRTCEYASEPGVAPVVALKRKYESLQAETADEHDLLRVLRSGSEAGAIRLLAYLRSSNNVQATLNQVEALTDETNDTVAPSLPLLPSIPQPMIQPVTTLPRVGPAVQPGMETSMPPLDAAHHPMSHFDTQTAWAPMPAPSIYPELRDYNSGVPWALPIEPYVCRHTIGRVMLACGRDVPLASDLDANTGCYSSVPNFNGESTSWRKITRRTPSAPEMNQNRKPPVTGTVKHPVAQSDSRLDLATTERWGITFISDDLFRKVMTSYIIWDHPCWGVFDINEFCEALAGKPSELASRLLVFAVLTYALVSLSPQRPFLAFLTTLTRGCTYILMPRYGRLKALLGRRPNSCGKKA
jgi:hypothetical protein